MTVAELTTAGEAASTAHVFVAKAKLREALALMPKQNASGEMLTRALVALDQARAELDAEIHARALASAQKAQGYDPTVVLTDVLGRKRSPAATPGYFAGRAPANKGITYTKDPLTTADIKQLMEACPHDPSGQRLRALILVLWRAGLRCAEALALLESDLDPRAGTVFVRNGKGGKSRTVGIDDWVWEQLQPWLTARQAYPSGPLFCVIEGPTAGLRAWDGSSVRARLRKLGKEAGVRKRCNPHTFRHTMTVELVTEEKSMVTLQRQLGHTNLAVTTVYVQGFPQRQVIDAIRSRPMPTLPAFGGRA